MGEVATQPEVHVDHCPPFTGTGTATASRSRRRTSTTPSSAASPGRSPADTAGPRSTASSAGRQKAGSSTVRSTSSSRSRSPAGTSRQRSPGRGATRVSVLDGRGRRGLRQRPDRRRSGAGPRARPQPRRHGGRIRPGQQLGQQRDGLRQRAGQLRLVGRVEPEREPGAQPRLPGRGRQQGLHERVPRQRPDPEGQVQGPFAERGGRVQPPARQVERVTGGQLHVQRGRTVGGRGHLVGPPAPRLPLQRVDQDRLVYPPPLAPLHLQHEHVVRVVMGGEALVAGRGQVGVDLHRGGQLGGQRPGQVDQRRPQPVQPLEHQRRAGIEQRQHPLVEHLVGDSPRPPRRYPCTGSPAARYRPWPRAGTGYAARAGSAGRRRTRR